MSKKDDKKVPESEIHQTHPKTSDAPASEKTAPAQNECSDTQQADEAVKQEEKASQQEEKAPEKTEAEILKSQLTDVNEKYLRLAAEYDNYRRRSQKERESIYSDVRADTVTRFLPIYDNLARAMIHEKNEEDKKGAEAILNQCKAVLTALGVTEIEAVGKKFDPSLHNAVLHVEDEKYGEGEIVLELEKGFKLGDKVIRFSTVQVAN